MNKSCLELKIYVKWKAEILPKIRPKTYLHSQYNIFFFKMKYIRKNYIITTKCCYFQKQAALFLETEREEGYKSLGLDWKLFKKTHGLN